MTKSDPTQTLFDVFENWTWTPAQLRDYRELVEQRKPYLLCITPRSGSTYFCDLLRRTRSAGIPAEYLRPDSGRSLLERRAEAGERNMTLLQYLSFLLDRQSSHNGAFGIKASYYQYLPFVQTGLDRLLFPRFRKVRLYRKNLVLQAISLYLATATGRWHSHQFNAPVPVADASDCVYDEAKIRMWLGHIWEQEQRWDRYFEDTGERVPRLWYEALQSTPKRVIHRVMDLFQLEVGREPVPKRSKVTKIGDARNCEWASEFVSSQQNVAFMHDLGISEARYHADIGDTLKTAEMET